MLLDGHLGWCLLPPIGCMLCLLGAGGYVGYAMTTRWGGVDASKLQMIGFDMGGTSTGGRCMPGSGNWQAGMAGCDSRIALSAGDRLWHAWLLTHRSACRCVAVRWAVRTRL